MMRRPFGLFSVMSVLTLAACGATSTFNMEDGTMRFLAPSIAASGDTVTSKLTPEQVAAAFRAAGYNRVSVGRSGKTVRIRSPRADMIACGEIVQQARGVQARFDGNARRAAILAASDQAEKDLLFRNLTANSELVLTQLDENTYQVREDHSVTLEYRWAVSGEGWTQTFDFGLDGRADFADKTQCVSASIAQTIL